MLSVRDVSLTLVSFTLVLFTSPAIARDAERMDEVVSASAVNKEFMGAALVAIGDEIVLDRAYGFANLEWNIANATQTRFRIGSVTKQFTAAAILLLQEEGKLTLDDPIGRHWAAAPETWDGITLRHLLHHTSGIPNFTSFEDFGTVLLLPKTRDEIIAYFADKPLDFAPGERWSYSNSGYVLLSAVVEKISGQSYAQFVDENIFKPLGMENTAIDVSAEIVPHRAAGYSPSADGIANAGYADMGIPTGAGALYSTTHDLLAWNRGLYGGKLLEPESLDTFLTSGKNNYALGVNVRSNEAGTTVEHNGGIHGFNAHLAFDPDNKITVVVLGNLNGDAPSQIAGQLMKLARGGDVILPGERSAIAIAPDALDQYAGTFAIAPTFKITVFRDGDALKAQATGQPEFGIFAEGEDRFFLKAIDAQLRFDRNEAGQITGLTLFQEGREIPAAKE